jgi:hypothetical protein
MALTACSSVLCVCAWQAEKSWSKDLCCETNPNDCYSNSCTDRTASSDYLYRLSPGDPERYEPIPGGDTAYQRPCPINWPHFGSGVLSIGRNVQVPDLYIGDSGPPGTYGYCNQGGTYRGHPSAACGGYDNWGHTDLEVWRPL